MITRRATYGLVATIFAGCLALGWPGAAQAQVKLEFKFPEGKKRTYKTTTKMRQVLTLMGSQIGSEEERTTVASLTVGARRADSSLPIEKKTESYRAVLLLPGDIKVAYDSSDPNTKIDNPDFAFVADQGKLQSEIVYTILLDDHNKAKAVEGTEKLQEKAEKLDPISREMVHSHIDPAKLKAALEQELNVLPDGSARPGEPWERTATLDEGIGTYSFRMKYEYLGTEKQGEKTLDKISSKVIEVSLKQDPEINTPLKIVKSTLKVDSSDGTIRFDRDEGHVIDSKQRMRLKGDVTFVANGTNVAGALDLRITIDTALQPAVK
jgi:hypothetical protein